MARPMRRAGARRRFLLVGLLVLLGVVVCLPAIPAVRTAALREALARAGRSLPGRVEAERATWPRIGELELTDLRWIQAPDTLLAVDRVSVHLDLGALARGDIRVDVLRVDGLRADVVGCRAALYSRGGGAPETERRRFPRTGSLPPIPSVAIDDFRLDAPELRFSIDGAPSSAALEGALDLRRGHEPHLLLRTFRADHPPANLTLGPGSLELSPGRGSGTIPGRWRDDWPFALTADSATEDLIRLELTETGPEAGGAVVEVVARTHRSGISLRWIDVSADLRSPRMERLARIPSVASHLPALPPSGQLVAHLEGNMFFQPRRESRFHIELREPFAAIDTLALDLHVERGMIDASPVRLVGGGLAATANWHRADGMDRLDANVDVNGSGWLAPWAPDFPRPDSLDIALQASAEGPVGTLRGRASVDGWVVRGATRVDSLQATAEGAFAGNGPLAFDVALLSAGHWLTGAGEIAERMPLRVVTSAWSVSPERMSPPAERPVTFTRSDRDSSLRVEGFELAGTLGNVKLDGEWSPAHGGAATLLGSWPRPPLPLLARLGAVGAERAAAAWPTVFPPFVKVRASADSTGAWSAGGEFRLPGPALAAAIADSPADIRDLGTLSGTVRAHGSGAELAVTVDAGQTEWVDALRIVARRAGDAVEVDSLVLALEGLDLRASGAWAPGGEAQAEARVDVEGTRFLRRFAPDLPEGLTLATAADIRVNGPVDAPNAKLDVALQAAAPGWSVPGSLTHIDVAGGALRRVAGHVVDTLRVGDRSFHELVYEVQPLAASEPSSLFPLLASVRIEGTDFGATVVSSVERDSAWTAQADTLAFRMGEQALTSRGPAVVRWDPTRRELAVAALRLDGSLGTLAADGVVGTEHCDFELRWTLPSLDGLVPVGMSFPPIDGIDGTLRVVRADSIHVDVALRGLVLGATGAGVARVQGRAGPEGTHARVTLEAANQALATADLTLPFRVDAAARTWTDTGAPWDAELVATGLPLPLRLGVPSEVTAFFAGESVPTSRIDGHAHLAGAANALTGDADLAASFPDLPRLRNQRVRVEATLNERGDGDEITLPGLRARATWSGVRTGEARAEVALPGLSTAVPGQAVSPGDSLAVHVLVSDWSLDDLNALLPPDVRLGGRLNSDLKAEGSPTAPRLSGWFEGKQLTVDTAKGDRARAQGRVEFAGSTEAPQVEGKLTVTQALLFVPEPPKALHDAYGKAFLWSDSTAAAAGSPPTTSEAARAATTEALDLGIDVSIPGAFWIRGRGLNVELAGELALVFRRGRPTVRGELRAVRGSLTFIGQRFNVDRGTATFFGDDNIDPELDIELSRQRGDLRAIVRVAGPASSPRIELTSQPPMEEADIMSQLVFGRASSELDREQTGFLQSQATAALEMYAIPGLEKALARRIGLDVLRVRRREDAREDYSIVVGKYLSPRALLKYDQGLDRGSDFSINLEYWLSRHVRLETVTSRQEASGIEVNWSSDY